MAKGQLVSASMQHLFIVHLNPTQTLSLRVVRHLLANVEALQDVTYLSEIG